MMIGENDADAGGNKDDGEDEDSKEGLKKVVVKL